MKTPFSISVPTYARKADISERAVQIRCQKGQLRSHRDIPRGRYFIHEDELKILQKRKY